MPVTKSIITTLEELPTVLPDVLRRLIQKDNDRHPFVIVDARPFGVLAFVQFAGARDMPLVYDCPPLNVFNERCLLDVAVERGLDGLRQQYAQPRDTLLITESEDRPRFKIRDLFRRLVDAF